MTNNSIMTGMVLSTMPVGDFDKRVVLLTKEGGKVSAFARGARRPHSQLLAASTPMNFGTFELFFGRNSNSLSKASIDHYFMEIPKDFEKLCLASYFLEVAEYFAQEGNDERERLILLYQTMRALESGKFSNHLIRIIYEIKTMAINGEYPDVFSCGRCGKNENLHYFNMVQRMVVCEDCFRQAAEGDGAGLLVKDGSRPISNSALYAFQFIISTPSSKVYSFKLKDEVEEELWMLLREYRDRYQEHKFKSEEFLNL